MGDVNSLRDGRFILGEPIGEGAQGRTFEGVDTRPARGGRRAVAIKRFDVRGATSWKDVELAEREARVLKALRHPRLPAYVDHFEQDGALYLVMEKIEGESLGALRRRGGSLREDEVLRLLHDASDVLDYLHTRAPPVIHRDLKPGNVIRRPDGSFAFVDFGAVRDKLRPKAGSTVVGTFGYMAPEQMQGRALAASDVYAMGATALAMWTGCEPEDLPHRGLAIDVREALRRTRRARADARLIPVLERMLDPDPDRRASRIGPLLAQGGLREDFGAIRWQDAADEFQDRLAGQLAKHAERAARRAARRARRVAHRADRWRRRDRPFFPWPARLLFALVFTAGMLAVLVATQVVVPLVLRLLSIFVARQPLREAADAVRGAGTVAVDSMAKSRRWLFGDLATRGGPSPTERVRVDGTQAPQPGHAAEPDPSDVAAEEEAADETARPLRR